MKEHLTPMPGLERFFTAINEEQKRRKQVLQAHPRKFLVAEDNGDGLSLFVFAENSDSDKLEYVGCGFEGSNVLWEVIDDLKDGFPPQGDCIFSDNFSVDIFNISQPFDTREYIEELIDKGFDIRNIDTWLPLEEEINGWDIVADENGFYFKKMGAAAIEEFTSQSALEGMGIKEITKKEAEKIIEERQPKGLFFYKTKIGFSDGFVAIDNRTGDAWTEDFCEKWEVAEWLTNQGTVPKEYIRERELADELEIGNDKMELETMRYVFGKCKGEKISKPKQTESNEDEEETEIEKDEEGPEMCL